MFSFLFLVLVVTGVTAVPKIKLTHDISDDRTRIINGEEASYNEFKHQLTLLRNGYHTCGASIIAANWALTAAHCVDGVAASSLEVAGNFTDFNNAAGYFISGVSEVIMHESYGQGSGAFPNDVALLRLPNNVDWSSHKVTVANGATNMFDGDKCIISGWGVTEGGSGATKLMKATVDVLTVSECRSAWGASNILTQHICVQGRDTSAGTGSCNGDSGGPLTCGNVLAGLTSWGRNGCHSNGVVEYPSVYARATSFYSWINTNCGCL